MLTSIKRGLTGLTQFEGRDRPGDFWPYALLVIALVFVALPVAWMPEFSRSFAELERFAAEHPEAATVMQTPGGKSIEIHSGSAAPMPDFGMLLGWLVVIVGAMVAALAAAVTRRLHDRGRSGFWGLPPVIFLLGGLVGFSALFRSFMGGSEPDMGLFLAVFLNNVLYLVSLVTLVVMLLGGTKPGDNRYGPEPE